jgi:hypothetical protein
MMFKDGENINLENINSICDLINSILDEKDVLIDFDSSISDEIVSIFTELKNKI